ncbi:MAG TPA: hypothetical protein VEL76_16865 [Gemmataceae bacterium]|nr:hypothetical protein [Gemmataceae bacterium]
MNEQRKAVAFDVDSTSLVSLREAFPEWEIQSACGANTRSLAHDWSPTKADLLIVGAREHLVDTLGLCRGLRSQAGRSDTPLLVLVLPAQEALVRAALAAGANSCLILPVHAKEFARNLKRITEGNWPGRHALSLDQPQGEDPWQDEGGEA